MSRFYQRNDNQLHVLSSIQGDQFSRKIMHLFADLFAQNKFSNLKNSTTKNKKRHCPLSDAEYL